MMDIVRLLSRKDSLHSPAGSASRREPRRTSHQFQIAPPERFEDRSLMAVGLIAAGTGSLTGPNFATTSYANTIGFTATVPTLSSNGNSVVLAFTRMAPRPSRSALPPTPIRLPPPPCPSAPRSSWTPLTTTSYRSRR